MVLTATLRHCSPTLQKQKGSHRNPSEHLGKYPSKETAGGVLHPRAQASSPPKASDTWGARAGCWSQGTRGSTSVEKPASQSRGLDTTSCGGRGRPGNAQGQEPHRASGFEERVCLCVHVCEGVRHGRARED